MRTTRGGVAGGLLLVTLLGGCVAGPVEKLDLAAQRAEYQAITVDYLRYVAADQRLSEDERLLKQATAAAQDLRLRKAEEAAGIVPAR